MQHSNFVHLHLHTQYSLLDGAIRPDALIARALEYKMPAVAMTDHGNLFGAIDFYRTAMAKGVKPIIGCEVYVAPRSRTDKTPASMGGASVNAYHLVLLVKNAVGYHNLCRLLTKAYLEGFYYKPRVDKALLAEYNEGLIAMSACLHGEVGHLISMGRMDAAKKTAAEYKEMFSGKRFYLELQHNGIPEQERVNAGLLEISRAQDIPVVATNDCHYLDRKDSRVHDILLCIQTGATVNTSDRMKFSTDELYFKSPKEMTDAFKDTPEAVASTVEIAERCNLELKFGEHHLPEFPVPEGETLETLIDGMAKEGLEKRLSAMSLSGPDADALRLHYFERLQKELRVIKGMGFPGYFLIVADFIAYAKRRKIPVGPGRGSAAGSLVAYCLGITNVDSIKHNLLFERFLNPDRISLPDIDVDFCFEKRDEVIKYVTEKYGADNVSQIITFGQLKARACIRDVGRALDIPYGEVDKIAKLVPEELDITLKKALEKEPRLLKLTQEDPRVKDLIEVATALEGLPRHASTHAAGVVISNKPLVEYAPMYMSQKDSVVTTQYDMEDVEKIGLVKFDFLGLKTLTVIDKTLLLVKNTTGEIIELENLALDDAKIYGFITSAATDGVFQLESSGMKDLLRRLKPENFEELVAAIALYRPGPIKSGMVEDYINRKHKRVPTNYELPELKAVLENTHGVMVYQEQVMEIAHVLAGFTPGMADLLRKAMGKKKMDVMVEQKQKFLEGAKAKRIPAQKAEKIFDQMVNFAEYGFNKSHSAAYALITYQTAYLKYYHPVEFMAALLGSVLGNTDDVVKYVYVCREMNITILPPDLNKSSMEFTVEGVDGGNAPSGGNIRFGLGAVKNVGSSAIVEIMAVRQAAPFDSLVDFLSRVDTRKVNKKVVESLVKCGAFDFTGSPRGVVLSSIEASMRDAEVMQRDRTLGQQSIFDVLGSGGGGGGRASTAVKAGASTRQSQTSVFTEKELLAFEKETLGFYLSSHPLAALKKELDARTTCPLDSVKDRGDESAVTLGGIVAEVKETITKKGDRMAFARLEDMTGYIEAVIFSDVYKKAMDLVKSDRPIVISGRLDKGEKSVKIVASEILPLEDAKPLSNGRPKYVRITVPADAITVGWEERLVELKNILKTSPGQSPVVLCLASGGKETLIALPDDLRVDPFSSIFEEMMRGFAGGVEIKLV